MSADLPPFTGCPRCAGLAIETTTAGGLGPVDWNTARCHACKWMGDAWETRHVTVAVATAVVQRIRDLGPPARSYNDDKAQHILEDAIRAAALRAVVRQELDATHLAAIALSTETVPFARWCA